MEQQNVDMAAVARAALAERQAGEDLDEALLRACKQLCGERGTTTFEAVRHALDALATRMKTDVEGAARQLADGNASVRVHTIVNVKKKIGFGGKQVQSLDELPPEARAQVEKALAEATGSISITKQEVRSGPSPAPALPATPHLCRCSGCGYQAPVAFSTCPQCMKEQKRSFWWRLLGE